MICFVVCDTSAGRSEELAEAMLMVFVCGVFALPAPDSGLPGAMLMMCFVVCDTSAGRSEELNEAMLMVLFGVLSRFLRCVCGSQGPY